MGCLRGTYRAILKKCLVIYYFLPCILASSLYHSVPEAMASSEAIPAMVVPQEAQAHPTLNLSVP